mmetsp:Transcript_18035/g.44562  ORF Transcript_18035/g.44562 Transcript_18035/m.44562 type:complete len:176 (+) Transcript_18035:65-592(+)|eukprot:CAMPEP_0113617382 /NCGR_PEP_ID=MMETSP0017_2-20120614/8751_1 /TAXON_ID=2856 /ORGANISM="Cylindrotheca closterium" /LENGTH=175 /DNA_ID=CAMNT_0000526775 /DNA_START=65 /DNA_END=595 /DNA_ORIENTATION=- /assembly_acc=CAM_ASM_000147
MASAETELAATSIQKADSKIRKDLETVQEKMDLCTSMLHPGAATPSFSTENTTMMNVVGFLEACVPRMVELVEVAAMGAVSEEVLMECLQKNDALQKLLADIDTAAMTETSASTTTASAAGPSVSDQLDDLLLDDGGAAAANFTIGDDDEDDDQKPPAKSDDEFDSFFAERTAGK